MAVLSQLAPMASQETLYERLGGQEAIDAVVEEFYDHVLADEQLQPYFEAIDTDELRTHQKEFLRYVTDGVEDYEGPSMHAAHAHLDITAEAFDRVATHLDASLRACRVADTNREELLAEVAALEDEIVTA